ncbi:MAG TPA: hypothetical protein PKW72_10155 [Treponemataceae bacterium]|nr:hypothetical protein [Treponemataceae bacterium]
MKHLQGKTIQTLFIAAALAVLASGCSEDPIFSAVEAEVELKDPSVLGTVLSLVSHDGSLYTANGNLYRRTGGSGDWRKVSLPSGASRCSQVATTTEDGTGSMFGLFQNSDWSFHSIQRYTGTGWEPVTGATNGFAIKNGNGFIFFFREDSMDDSEGARIIQSAHRIAPDGTMTGILSELEYYKGSGERLLDAEGDYFITNRAVYTAVSGNVISNTTDVNTTSLTALAVNGSDVYVANSGYVWHFNGSVWTRFSHDADGPVYGLTYMGAAGKNLLLLPCSEGYGEVLLDSSGRPETYQEPGKSAASSISTSARSQYSSTMDDWLLLSAFVVTDPVPAGNQYVLYVGVMDPLEDGLWGYYSETRREWNRE